jgi:hypothetical protein
MHLVRWWNMFMTMGNAFGLILDDASVRRAVAEGVPETVIAAIRLLHERSAGEIAAWLRPDELEHVIRLVGRCPSCYPPGTLDALKGERTLPPAPTESLVPAASDEAAHPHPQPRRPPARPEARHGTPERPERPNAPPKPTGFQGPPGRENSAKDSKSGTLTGTAAETARRRLIVEDLMKAGLSVRMISGVTDISRSAVHRAMMALARAEARKELAIGEIASELLGRKLSRRRQRRA